MNYILEKPMTKFYVHMATSIMYHILFLLTISTSLAQQISGANIPWNPRKHVALFVFGDSLLDAGANTYINTTPNFRANFYPYGESFFKPHPTGRFCDGRLICDFIADYAGLPLIPTYLQPGNKDFVNGTNFASGGAGALVGTNKGFVVDLKRQLKQFENVAKILKQKHGDERAKKIISEAVYLTSIGGNDYLWNSTAISMYSPEDYVAMVIGNITDAIKDLYGKGARKFAYLGQGPFGCLPGRRLETGACSSMIDELVRLHNKALPRTFKKLQGQLNKFNYTIFNLYKTLGDRINNPTKYGFDEGKVACCGSGRYRGEFTCGGMRGIREYVLCENPRKYVIFYSLHPTEATDKQLAKLVWNGTQAVISPYNLKSFFEH